MSTQVVWPLQQDVRSGGAVDEQQTLSSSGREQKEFTLHRGTPEHFAVICSFT